MIFLTKICIEQAQSIFESRVKAGKNYKKGTVYGSIYKIPATLTNFLRPIVTVKSEF